MWNCGFTGCNKASVRTYGECVLCDRHLCAKHLEPKYHTCPRWEKSRSRRNLVHRFLLDKVPEFCSRGDLDGNYYLKHADEKGDQILVDDEFNITGIIDWEWAYTDSKSAAFNSPIVLLPVADFYEGVNRIGDDEKIFAQAFEEKGHPDLGAITRNGRVLHRFRFCCGYDLADWEEFLGLFAGLLKEMCSTKDFHWETWKVEALEQYRDDHQLQELMILN